MVSDSSFRSVGSVVTGETGSLGLRFSFQVGGFSGHRSDGLFSLGFISQVGGFGGHRSDGLLGLGFIFRVRGFLGHDAITEIIKVIDFVL